MRAYTDVYRSLGLPEPLVACALGQIEIPLIDWESPACWYVFPPALIPIASNGSGPNYIGYWKHWFADREPTFVKMYVESGSAVEIARTPKQLFSYLAMDAITFDEGISPAIRRFASAVGIGSLQILDTVSRRTGDNPLEFAQLPEFAGNLPLVCIKNHALYEGGFPTDQRMESPEWQAKTCSFELPPEALMGWPTQRPKPDWLAYGSLVDVFDRFLRSGNLSSAWMTLNSTGWAIPDAKRALARLAKVAKNKEFNLLVSAWSSVADPSCGGY